VILTRCPSPIRLPRLLQSQLRGEGEIDFDLIVHGQDAVQAGLGQLDGGNLTLPQQFVGLMDGQFAEVQATSPISSQTPDI